MGVGAGLHMYDVVVKSSRSLSHVLMSFLSILLSPITNLTKYNTIQHDTTHYVYI